MVLVLVLFIGLDGLGVGFVVGLGLVGLGGIRPDDLGSGVLGLDGLGVGLDGLSLDDLGLLLVAIVLIGWLES
jgi:hypothetical protein